jgi:CBS domain-containing protein
MFPLQLAPRGSTPGLMVDAIAAMLDAQVSALPVLDTHGKPVGVVTRSEILRASLYDGGSRGSCVREGRS